ncbi:MAG: hypothetical protein ABI894_17095 [Ilumatobacteraceae bacterium]
MNKNFALLSLVALAITACGSSDGQAATANEGDDFCKLAQTAKDDNDELDTIDPTDSNAVKLTLGGAIDSLSAAAAKAPKDIVDTVKDLLANEEKLEGLLKDNDYDFEKFAASDEGKAMLDDDSISKTGDELDAYLTDKCGIDTSDGTSDSTVDTIAVEDTILTDGTIVSLDTIVDLGEGEDAINKFLDFYELGTGATLTDEERTCIVASLVDKVTGADLNQAISGQPSQDVQLALGTAFIDCQVAVQS